MVAGATMLLVGGLATDKETASLGATGLVFKTRSSSKTAEKAAVCWLSELKRTEAMPLPVNTNDFSRREFELTIKPAATELNCVPLASKAVAVHCGCETSPEGENSPARVKPKDC